MHDLQGDTLNLLARVPVLKNLVKIPLLSAMGFQYRQIVLSLEFFMNQLIKRLGIVLFGLGLLAEPHSAILAEGDSYRLSIGDRIVVELHGQGDLATTQEIDSRGSVRLKYVGIVSLEGLNLREAEQVIEREYVEQEYLRAPDASVRIDQYSSKPVVVRGAVNKPGLVELDRFPNGLDIFNVIAMAGGLSDVAKESDIQVVRTDPDGKASVFSVDMSAKGLKRKVAGKERFIVMPHDIIEVSETTF